MSKIIGFDCMNCDREFENPAYITDPDSDYFDEMCCPYCESIHLDFIYKDTEESFTTIELPYTFENGYLEVTKNLIEYGFAVAKLIEPDPIPF